MKRRQTLMIGGLSWLAVSSLLKTRSTWASDAVGLRQTEWIAYSARFIARTGRVVDTGNRGISHSEGQGYGMLLAVAFDDPVRFDEIWQWTRRHLQKRQDRLFAWKWDPLLRGGSVSDMNNASDGDLLIAWALIEASERWDNPAFLLAAELVWQEISDKLIENSRFGPLLLPAVHGFRREQSIVVNPSYWVFPGLARLAEVTNDPLCEHLIESGLELLQTARFGEHDLPADWIEITGDATRLAADFPQEYGFNAVRLPLYLAWYGRNVDTLIEPFLRYARMFSPIHSMPAVLKLDTSATSEYSISLGVSAIYTGILAQNRGEMPAMPNISSSDDYYSSTLLLLSKAAF